MTIAELEQKMPWAVQFVREVFSSGLLICLHGRQLTMCAVCTPACEEAYAAWRKEQS